MTLGELLAGTFAALAVATVVAAVVPNREVRHRVTTWWGLCGATAIALWLGEAAVLLLFCGFSLLGLREFPGQKRRAAAPIALAQYVFVYARWPWAFFAFVPLAGLAARSFWPLMVCAYGVSFAPGLFLLGADKRLVFYLLIVVEASDVLQYLWGKLLRGPLLAPAITPRKTWSGLIGGVSSATALGTALHAATPFSALQAAAVCVSITLAGVAGGLVMSAIKRRAGIKDFGTLLPGHGGMLDRLDSLMFAAPVFFFAVRTIA